MLAHQIVGLATALVVALGAPAWAGMMGERPPAGHASGMGPGGTGGMRGGGGMMTPGHRMMRHEGPLLTMMLRHSQDLGLSPEQEKTLLDLRTEFAKESVKRTAEIRVAQIEPKVKQIAALEGDRQTARLGLTEAMAEKEVRAARRRKR